MTYSKRFNEEMLKVKELFEPVTLISEVRKYAL
jgi:hypothetical protein